MRAIPVNLRTAIVITVVSCASLMAFIWPLLVKVDPAASVTGAPQGANSPVILIVLLPLLLIVVLAEISSNGIDARALAVLTVLSGIGGALRPLGAGLAGIETVFFLVILAGRVYGPGFGFVLGNTTLFASALITGGVGPWLPFQMIAAGWAGLGAGLLPKFITGRWEVAILAAYGGVAGVIFGLMMNLWFWPFAISDSTALSYVPGASVMENLHRLLIFSLATSMGWDIGRAVTNVVLIAVTGTTVLAVLRRASAKAAFDSPGTFDDSPSPQLPASSQLPV